MMHRLAVLFLLSVLASVPAAAVYEIGDVVADFTLVDLDSASVSLYDFEGDIVVLNFFKTTCPSCDEEAQSLEHDIWEVYRDRGLTVISVDIEEPRPLVRGWSLANEITYHLWLAPDWAVYNGFYEFWYVPYNTVLDRQMKLRYSQIGYDETQILETIETILDEDSTPVGDLSTWGEIKALYR